MLWLLLTPPETPVDASAPVEDGVEFRVVPAEPPTSFVDEVELFLLLEPGAMVMARISWLISLTAEKFGEFAVTGGVVVVATIVVGVVETNSDEAPGDCCNMFRVFVAPCVEAMYAKYSTPKL